MVETRVCILVNIKVRLVRTNAFGKYGTIHDDSWIQISPPGYDAIVLPLDGQSAERRDYHDGNPVMITVLFRRAGDE